MTEKLLHFIWQFGYYNRSNLTTTAGEALTILSPGILNKNQGPDFMQARVKIGETVLAGTIELHLRTSDWIKHQHEQDVHYKNVILHVVAEHDEPVNDVPVLDLSHRISALLVSRYASFMQNTTFIPCGDSMQKIHSLTFSAWKERLVAERMTRKSTYILDLLKKSNHHWEETFWWILARNFGGKINGETFESIARTIPINILARHKSSVHQVEALLFGQANLLDEEVDDDYPKLLQREYQFLRKKYGLLPSAQPLLFLRMRPGNFPSVRLAQLAMLICQRDHLFSRIIEASTVKDITPLFSVTANDFWHYHYSFKHPSPFKKKTVGASTIYNIIINTVVPVLFSYGLYHKDENIKEKAIGWLQRLSSEQNVIIDGFDRLGIKSKTAFDSQALLELKNAYCNQKNCLDCAVGNLLLKEAAHAYKVLKPQNGF